MKADIALPELKALLQAQILPLVRELAPEGSVQGASWLASNPTRIDRNPSFGIYVRGPAAGGWKDFATGDTGDVIDLIAYTQFRDKTVKAARGEAIRWAKAWLGIEGQRPRADVQRRAEELAKQRVVAEQQEAAARVKQQKAALALWLECWVRLQKTPAEAYLKGRGIDLDQLPRYPSSLRYAPNMPHKVYIDGEVVETRWPCIVAGMTHSETNKIVAIHRTWLAEDGSGKAPVDPPRKIWPSFSGAAIRLARGETGLSAAEAEKAGKSDRLAITEGIEDGLSVALACPELRVWAAGALANLANLKLPACSAEVVVCADNDWGKPQAERLLNRGLEALAAQGARVLVARSRIGKDVNDALRGEAA